MREIQAVLDSSTISVAREEWNPKAAFLQHVVKIAPSHILLELLRQARAKKKRRIDAQEKRGPSWKRVRRRLEEIDEEVNEENEHTDLPPGFLQGPTPHTSNGATHNLITPLQTLH